MKYFKDKYNTIFGYTEEQIDLIDTSDKTELTQFEIKKYVFKEKTKEEEDLEKQVYINNEALEYLSSTDWLMQRHADQLALSIPTSLTNSEYLDILTKRQSYREKVI